MRKSEIIFTALLLPIDFLMIVLAAFAAYWLRLSPYVASLRPVLFNIPAHEYFWLAVVIALIWMAVFALIGLYKMKRRKGVVEDFSKILVGTTAGLATIAIYLFLKREWFDSRFLVMVGWVFAVFSITIGRYILSLTQRILVGHYNWGAHHVLIVGGDGLSEAINREICEDPSYGFKVVKQMADLNMVEIIATIKNLAIDDVILANPDFNKEAVVELVEFCNEKRIGFRFVPNLFQTLTSNIHVDTIAAVPIIELKRTALDGWGKIIKRIIDVVGAALGLVIASPFFLLIAIFIKYDSEGSVFVRLKRVRQNKEFRLLKFRSMVKNAEELKKQLLPFNERQDGPLFKMKNDPRITRVGKFLRKTRLDELPQLVNVLKGDMSLVGPRPHQPDEISAYKKHHKQLLVIKPGITGMAQISGSSDLDFEKEVRVDTFYIENWSLVLDFKILVKTFFLIFKDKSAC